ncbi:MAG: Gfo/Idh/MocA family oxidoreductase [Planctomycetia bacterium]|nr:Gfo/Idh/MocA family oxidoreductase [Planctomycetia bacterium]
MGDGRLNLAVIGTGGRGKENLGAAFCENVIAVCDTDGDALERAVSRCCDEVRAFFDYRELFAEVGDALDAVVINVPDHMHFSMAMAAMERGLHVYCEKPLAHSVMECRLLAEKAAEKNVVTQTGMQMHALPNYRRVVEMLQAGAIGDVQEVHVWCGKGWGGTATRPNHADPVPRNLHWDEWLGGAPKRPYVSEIYTPANWRRWWDFGSGTLGDMACHLMDLPFWALRLEAPKRVWAEGPDLANQTEMAPLELEVHYTFDTPSGELGLHWYDGGRKPAVLDGTGMENDLMGVVFCGTRGNLLANYHVRYLWPEEAFVGYVPPPPSIPPSPGHFVEWIRGIREGRQPSCCFAYTSKLTEAVLLGVAAYRSGKEIDWDSKSLSLLNENPQAEKFVKGNLP